MIRLLTVIYVASAAAESCGGALPVDPRDCTGSPGIIDPNYDSGAVEAGETAWRILMMSTGFEDGDAVYVRGLLQEGQDVLARTTCSVTLRRPICPMSGAAASL